MATYVDNLETSLQNRKTRVLDFFVDLDLKLSSLSAPTTYHQDIYWDGGFVRVTATDAKLSVEPNTEKLKYYNQGLGLLKLAINKAIY
jgi:hypothetical protein